MKKAITARDELIYEKRKELSLEVALEEDFLRKEVIISNSLARSKVAYTLEEEKLLYYLFAHLNPFGENEPRVVLNKTKIIELFGASSEARYTILKDRFTGLIFKSLLDIRDGKRTLIGIVIIDVEWTSESEDVIVDLNPKFMPYIQNLTSFYTRINWEAVRGFTSKHALRLYKYLSSWSVDDEAVLHTFTTKELKKFFSLEKDDYTYKGKFMRHLFEKYVLNAATNEINALVPEMRLMWYKQKKGGRIAGYTFEWILWKENPEIDVQMTIDDLL